MTHQRQTGSHGFAGIVFVILVNCGCGYTLTGQGAFLPDYIQTIGVPMFENATTIFEIEQALTQEVRSEFIGRGSYRVVATDTGVDAVLSVTINDISITPARSLRSSRRPVTSLRSRLPSSSVILRRAKYWSASN